MGAVEWVAENHKRAYLLIGPLASDLQSAEGSEESGLIIDSLRLRVGGASVRPHAKVVELRRVRQFDHLPFEEGTD